MLMCTSSWISLKYLMFKRSQNNYLLCQMCSSSWILFHKEQNIGAIPNCSLSFSSHSCCHRTRVSLSQCLLCWPTHLLFLLPCSSYLSLDYCNPLLPPAVFWILVPSSFLLFTADIWIFQKEPYLRHLLSSLKNFSSLPLCIELTSKSMIWHSKLVKWVSSN